MKFSLANACAHAAPPAPLDAPPSRPALLVVSSLRWNSDWQRLQHLLTRLASHYRIFHLEEPVTTHRDPHLAWSRPAPGIEVLVPNIRSEAAGFADEQMPVLRALLGDFLREQRIADPLVWLSTPQALPLLDGLDPRGVIYDCAQDLSGAAPPLRLREQALMAIADVVIAGGPSLYQSRRALNTNMHCIPNAVDAAHFAPLALGGPTIESISARAIHAAIPGPRLGWFGAIDDRVDLDLIAQVADLRPDWQLVMAGPVVGIDAPSLPRRPNIHWLGPQTRAIQPYLQAHWDVCLLPLKCDVATRLASPLQTLEYLAGQKPVVSTPIPDVVALHGHIVHLGADPSGFVQACRAALCERGPRRHQRRIDALIAVHSCSWDRAAERVQRLLLEFAPRAVPADAAPPPWSTMQRAPARSQYALG